MKDPASSHWQSVYEKPVDVLSWTRSHLDLSLQLLTQQGIHPGSRFIDVGAGVSTLVDDLLTMGLSHLCVLDLSARALDQMRARLGARAANINWLCGDIRDVPLPARSFDFWHDRAVAHFLTDPADEAAYGRQVRHALVPGGIAVIAGFAPDGPERCSGLPVQRRDADLMHTMLGKDSFDLLGEVFEDHITPSGRSQHFCYGVFRKR